MVGGVPDARELQMTAAVADPPRYRALIREMLDESEAIDVHEVARAVLDALDAWDREEVLHDLMPHLVRLELGAVRRAPRHSDATDEKPRPGRSRRWDVVASTRPFHVNGEYRRLGTLTPDEAEMVAAEYEARAAANIAWAVAMRRLAEMGRQSGVTTLAELGDD